MKLVTENFLLAISIFFIGTLLSIIISKLSKIFFKKISKRTKTNFDDFIFEVISGIIKPIGFLLSFYFSIDYFFADEITFISVLLNILKLFIEKSNSKLYPSRILNLGIYKLVSNSQDFKEKNESDKNKMTLDIFEKLSLPANKAEKDIGIYKSSISKMEQAKELIEELRIKDKKKNQKK